MTVVTGVEQRSAWYAKTMPAPERVTEHVWSIPVACAPFPVRYTLAYALANAAGDFVIVDPGWDSADGRAQLSDGLRAAGLATERLVGVVVTHFHPDHVGMAQRLADRAGAWIAMHPLDTFQEETPAGARAAVESDAAWLRACGVPDLPLEAMVLTEEVVLAFSRPTRSLRPLTDRGFLPLAQRRLEIVWTPGHSAGHVCLIDHDDELVLTGDHVLPRISPNIGIGFHDGDRDSVAEYVESLASIAAWDGFEVCPAHEWRFRGLAERCRELTVHHRDRGREVRSVIERHPGASVWEVAGRLTWSRGWEHLDTSGRRGALAETFAHLRHLARTTVVAVTPPGAGPA